MNSCKQSTLDVSRALISEILPSFTAELATRPVREVLVETINAIGWAVSFGAGPAPEAAAVLALLTFYSPAVISRKHAERIEAFKFAVSTARKHASTARTGRAFKPMAIEARDRWVRISGTRAQALVGTSYYPRAVRRLNALIAEVQS